MTLDRATVALWLAGAGVLVAVALGAFTLPAWAALVLLALALVVFARAVVLLIDAVRETQARRREAALVDARLAEVRELRPTDELERAVDPTPGTVRRARQSRGARTPRPRKRRNGRWG